MSRMHEMPLSAKCEGCGQPATHITADDVELCADCYFATPTPASPSSPQSEQPRSPDSEPRVGEPDEPEGFDDNDALQILCRAFDNWEPLYDEWLGWYNPANWLHKSRGFGAFMRKVLNSRNVDDEKRDLLASVAARYETIGKLNDENLRLRSELSAARKDLDSFINGLPQEQDFNEWLEKSQDAITASDARMAREALRIRYGKVLAQNAELRAALTEYRSTEESKNG